MAAIQEVFAIAELVENIFIHLDEITLIRTQRVNKFCKAVLHGSPKLKQRLGFIDEGTKIHVNNSKVRWTPLFRWFEMHPGHDMWMRWETREWWHHNSRSISTRPHPSVMGMATTGLGTAQLSSNGIHRISATLPPVKQIRLDLPLRLSDFGSVVWARADVQNAGGVTIADVLRTWDEHKLATKTPFKSIDLSFPIQS